MSRIVQPGATGPFGLTANGTFQQQPQSINLYGGTAIDSSINTLLGSRWSLEDGRELVLILAGASNLAQGKLMQDAALVANHQNLTVTAVQAYNTTNGLPATVTVTLGGTAATLNQYQLGYAVVTSGTGLGQTLQIQENPAQVSTTGALLVTLADAPNVALDTTSKISLVPQPGNGVIINPHGGVTNKARGVTFYPVTAANYGYIVSKGTTACLIDATAPTAGEPIAPSTATDGAVGQTALSGSVVTTSPIGEAIVATTSAQYQPVSIDL